MREYTWTFDIFNRFRIGWITYLDKSEKFICYEPEYSTFRIYKLEFYKY